MRIVIVDEHDNEIGTKDVDARIPGKDIYRAAALWLTDSEGRVLMAQRAFKKRNSPGKWGPAAAGTVEEGETYESNIVKEIEEEIGIKVPLEALTKGPKHFIEEPGGRLFFDQWFLCTLDLPAEAFTLQEEEVEKVAWFTKEELREALAGGTLDLLPSSEQWMPTLLDL